MKIPAYLQRSIDAVRKLASELEDACPVSRADTPVEAMSHELIHALNDAANSAERQLTGTR